jgi:cysteine desulfurase
VIYLDHNATTPVLPEVLDAMLPWLREQHGNPSSAHALGARAKAAVEEARAHVAALLHAQPDEIVFTSSGTEASNIAIRGVCDELPSGAVVTSTIEHPATLAPIALLEKRGWRVRRCPVGPDGRVDLDEARLHIAVENVRLVSVMHSNNETGVLQPIARLVPFVRAARALLHVDAAQSVGKVPVDVRALDADLLTIAGHKLYAPKGVGALFVRQSVRGSVHPLVRGAGQESGLRPGTENVAGIVALGAAAVIAARDLAAEGERQRALRDTLYASLRARVPQLRLTGHAHERLPNTLHVRFPDVRGSKLLAACPDVAASTGSACHAWGETPSTVLLAMDIAPIDALGAVRLTLGRTTTHDDIGRAADALATAWQELQDARAVV